MVWDFCFSSILPGKLFWTTGKASFPETLIIPKAPTPLAVASAQMVSLMQR
jgi:hypothetical protein